MFFRCRYLGLPYLFVYSCLSISLYDRWWVYGLHVAGLIIVGMRKDLVWLRWSSVSVVVGILLTIMTHHQFQQRLDVMQYLQSRSGERYTCEGMVQDRSWVKINRICG